MRFRNHQIHNCLWQKHWLRFFVTVGAFLLFLVTSRAEVETEDKPETINRSFVTEGYTQLKIGDLEKALATFGKVLENDADNLEARLGKAMIFAEQERHEDAFAAYDWITQQNPKHIHAWNGRGLAAFNMENFDEALASFQMAVVDQPVNGFFYESIAWTQMCRGEFKDAAESAKQASLMYSRNGKTSLYPLLIAFFSYHESGDAENALRTLNYADNNKPTNNKWPAPIIDYLSGEIGEATLISFVSNPAEETEAHTYIGLYMRLLGKMDTASLHLSWVSEYGDTQVFEYTLAKVLNHQANIAFLVQ